MEYPYFDDSIGTINAAMIVTEETIEQRPELVQKLVDAHVQATQNMIDHPDDWLDLAASMGTDRELLTASADNIELCWQIDETYIEHTERLAEQMQALGLIDTVCRHSGHVRFVILGACRMKTKRFDPVGWIVPILVIAVWWAVTRFGIVAPYQLPSSQTLARVLVDFATGWYGLTPYAGTMFLHLWHSLYRVLTGFALAVVLGLPLGFATGRVRLLRRLLDPFLGLIRSVPGIGWLPIALVWFGVGEGNTRFLITLAAFFPFISIPCRVRLVYPI